MGINPMEAPIEEIEKVLREAYGQVPRLFDGTPDISRLKGLRMIAEVRGGQIVSLELASTKKERRP